VLLDLRVSTDTNLVHRRRLLGRWRTAAVQFQRNHPIRFKASNSLQFAAFQILSNRTGCSRLILANQRLSGFPITVKT
jgi:hypothetical protein